MLSPVLKFFLFIFHFSKIGQHTKTKIRERMTFKAIEAKFQRDPLTGFGGKGIL